MFMINQTIINNFISELNTNSHIVYKEIKNLIDNKNLIIKDK